MAYRVLARKWRPQRFDDVVGQQAVTRTLRNALASKRLAQSFVFAGPRGVGKTTTARILARALNCAKGPTADPCGECDACVEIAENRDIDVLEIDAATHTQVENIRDVIVNGLSIAPVRNRFKVFIIDEVHQLSSHSFNALLKSIEEPPPHVVFMMATTELEKIPETVLSRSQVYEFRRISTKVIVDQLRLITTAEQIEVPDEALHLVARDADGSMRDAQSKLDQVIAFTGNTITIEDIATVLGLVGRDLVLDTMEAVANEDAPAAFALAGRAVELGYDLRLVCRELTRAVRDLLVLNVDPSRAADPEIAAESERERLTALAGRFSREDLLRAFDLLTKAEQDLRAAAQPRYHLEMLLLRLIYLRKLVTIEDLIAGAGTTGSVRIQPDQNRGAGSVRLQPDKAVAAPGPSAAPPSPARATETASAPSATSAPSGGPSFKDAFLAEIRKTKAVLYNMVVAQAQKIEVTPDRVSFTFSAAQRTLRDTLDQNRPWLEATAGTLAGRKVTVVATMADAGASGQPDATPAVDPAVEKKDALRQKAMADAGVQAMLEVFPAEIRDIEEM